MTTLLIILILVCGAWAVVASVLIARYLEKHGISVNLLWLKVMILKYLGEYRKVTLRETQCVGPLFYHYAVPLSVALVLVIILIAQGLG